MLINKEKNFISAVIYLYGSDHNTLGFLKEIDHELKKNFENYEMIFVNDASFANEEETIKELSKSTSGALSMVNMSYHQGLEASMNAGADLAIGDFVYEFDTTIRDYDLNMIMDVYRKSQEGYDIVSAAPKSNRTRVSSLFYALYNKFSGTNNKLRTESFRLLSRRGINRIKAININIPYRKPIYANCGLPVYCIEYETADKGGIRTTESMRARQDMAISSIILFTDIAYRAAFWLSIAMMLGAASGGIYAFTVYMTKQHPIEGWTTTIMLLALCFCAMFALLALIIKYLSIILNMVFRKQTYLVGSIKKYGRTD